MLDKITITVEQMSILFIFIILGYVLQKLKVVPENSATVLSKLEMNIILPAFTFMTFSQNFTKEVVGDKVKIVLWATVLLVISGVVCFYCAKLFSKDKSTRAVYTYAFTIPNTGYMGYPLIGGVFGAAMLFDYMVLVIPYQIYIYTIAIYMLNPKHELSIKSIFNPSFVGMLLGAVWGIFELPLPDVAVSVLDSASGCLAPLAMLLTGFVLSRRPIMNLIKNPKMYLASLLRLIVFPVVFTAILWLLGVDNHILMLGALMLSLPMGLNNIVFPEAFGGDSYTGAQSCFVCNVLAFFTVPVMYALIEKLFG